MFGGLSTKFSPRYLVLLSTGELCIYGCKEDFDQRKTAEDVVSLEDVSAKKVRAPNMQSLGFSFKPHYFSPTQLTRCRGCRCRARAVLAP